MMGKKLTAKDISRDAELLAKKLGLDTTPSWEMKEWPRKIIDGEVWIDWPSDAELRAQYLVPIEPEPVLKPINPFSLALFSVWYAFSYLACRMWRR